MELGENKSRVLKIARAVEAQGGRAVAVGGFVRDQFLGIPSKDLDIEVFGLSLDNLQAILATFGEVHTVGKSFGVLQIKGLPVDFSLPRKDSKVAPGHRGFEITFDKTLSFEEAARRRDLTINSIGLDILTDEILDPFDGRGDLEQGILRATDARYFSEDPLRGVRVAQFAARFEMQPDAELIELSSRLDLSELPGERLWEEFRKLLLQGRRPSVGLAFLHTSRLLRFFPELDAIVGVPQDAQWHPEGDVWTHTLMVVDEAAKLRDGGALDAAMMFGALCHDFGKPLCTETDAASGRITSRGHEELGVEPARQFLARLRASNELTAQVAALVRHHLAPYAFIKHGAKAGAFRRLARSLGEVGLDMLTLSRVSTADFRGRTTPDARAGDDPYGAAFLEQAHKLAVADKAQPDVVLGRHLIAKGLKPGREFAAILKRARDVQDEYGWSDAEQILEKVLRE